MIEPECIVAIYEKAKGIYSGKDTLKMQNQSFINSNL